ncbi:MAG: hypothetical protein FWG75_07200 [Cystobacterineae bacterium]|nr:hypothetical protein [Cystobacterineae bacterium]
MTDNPKAETPAKEKPAPLTAPPERLDKYARGEIPLEELQQSITGNEVMYIAEIGYNLFQQGRYKDAKVIYDGLIALNTNVWYFHAALGAIQLEAHEAGFSDEGFSLDAALASLNRALELNPKDIASCVNRAEVYLYQSKIIEAVTDLKAAVEMDPEGKNEQSMRARRLAQEMLKAIEREENKKKENK